MLVSDLKPLALINRLIGLNNMREQGYVSASNQVNAAVLRDLFRRLAETSSLCRVELVREVHKLGGIPRPGGISDGAVNVHWSFVHQALSGNDHRALLSSCFCAEEVAVKEYENALLASDEVINSVQQGMFCRQYDLFTDDNRRVKNLLSLFSGS